MADYTVHIDLSGVIPQMDKALSALKELDASIHMEIASQFLSVRCSFCGADDRYDIECPACMAMLEAEALEADWSNTP